MEVFKGIPYAQPPVGKLRFQAPQAMKKWRGVRLARSFGPSAPQIGPVNRLIRTIIGAAGSKQSQDCLYLNVWTPAADDRRRPVMVWIHGGAFILGSGSTAIYSGSRLARRGDVVCQHEIPKPANFMRLCFHLRLASPASVTGRFSQDYLC